ncbi:element excision factor XisH family protein [Plectonema radiosum]
MPAKDIFHEVVKSALEKEGWRITHDPLFLLTFRWVRIIH